MKKTISLLLAVVLMISVFAIAPVTVSAAESGTTGDCIWTLDDEGVLTISGNGYMEDYSGDNNAPWYAKGATAVVIKKGVKNIGESAFDSCKTIKSASIANSVTSFGDFAFYDCNIGDDLVIPNSVTSIGYMCFYNNRSMSRVTIPENVTSIGDYAFGYLRGMAMRNGFTVYGKKGTAAENYVKRYSYCFYFVEIKNEPQLIGDVNNDKNIDVLDAILVQKHSVDKEDLNEAQLAAADVNNDNNVDVIDAAEIQKFAAGKITEFKKKA